MNVMIRVSGAALAVMLAGCGPEKNETTESPTSSSTTGPTGGSSSTGAEPTTTTATPTSGSGTGGESEGTTSTTAGGLCGAEPPADAEQQCGSQGDRASCDGLAIDGGRCLWIEWFPVRLMDGLCGFGDPRGQCAFKPCPPEEGCGFLSPCGAGGFGGAFVVGENEAVSVGFAKWCRDPPAPAQPCIFVDQQVGQGPPECACLCDPEFPGAN